MPFVPDTTVWYRPCAPFGLVRSVTPFPEPRRVMELCIHSQLFTMNVPALSFRTCPEGQLSSCAWIATESSPPLGESVAQIVVRLGIPPFDIIPGFHAKFLSGGMICGLFGGVTSADFFGKITVVFCDG